jgi:alkylhydroperoxidase/carboxymuconolactone decarboxylase family protein YurZ
MDDAGSAAVAGRWTKTRHLLGVPVRSAQLELLRRLALNDEAAVRHLMSGHAGALARLDDKTSALVIVAGLVSLAACETSLQTAVDTAHAAGAEDAEIIDVLRTVAPLVGTSRVRATAPRLALALGYELGGTSVEGAGTPLPS